MADQCMVIFTGLVLSSDNIGDILNLYRCFNTTSDKLQSQAESKE